MNCSEYRRDEEPAAAAERLPVRRDAGGRLCFDTPARAAGQRSAAGLAAPPKPLVRIGFIGLGLRGPVSVERLTHIEGVEIRALCDTEPERVAAAQRILAERGLPPAAGCTGGEGWRELCRRDDIDLVYICTPWHLHAPMAVYAMEQGRHVAVEVPAAVTVEECWQLVDTAERTQRHCMMLENCLYDRFELATLRMAREGLFGEVLHVAGAYIHCFDAWDDWRLEYNRTHRGDIYATHGLGPACRLLDIRRSDRLDCLVAMDTPSVNGRRRAGTERFSNGDQTTTLLRTERGRTLLLQHNVMTPRPYSRMFQVVGSEGFAEKYPVEQYAFSRERLAELWPGAEGLSPHEALPEERMRELAERYRHPFREGIEELARAVDPVRGGMNFVMDYRLVHCLRHGLPLDQDVYDAAEWSCIGALTALSLEHGSAPVAVPDFTRGGTAAL